jgi:flagellar hook protein FlgE
MSILTSLNSGTSGLEASSQELSVIGDNIANANTIGFKAGRAAFEDALNQTVIGGTGQIGLGARLGGVQNIISQGSLSNTGVATDLAIQGGGYFIVQGVHNGTTGTFYTRAGQFSVDAAGYLVNLEGLRVQGFPADPSGQLSGIPGDLLVGTASARPSATANINMKANLQSDAAILTDPWDPLNPSATSNFSTSMTIYDTLGSEHSVQVFFRKTAAGQWDWHAMTDGAGLVGGTAGVMSEIATGTLAFDANGALTAVTQASNFNPINATAPQPLNFNFGDPTSGGGTGFGGVTQFATASASTFIGQDGFGSGQLASIRIGTTGLITGVFTNGQTRSLGQVAVASFSAPDRLEKVAGNLLAQTAEAGAPVVGAPGTGMRGSVISGALEQSNVDLAEQFVRMISAQRQFQANSKTITTADQLLQELINLKR